MYAEHLVICTQPLILKFQFGSNDTMANAQQTHVKCNVKTVLTRGDATTILQTSFAMDQVFVIESSSI